MLPGGWVGSRTPYVRAAGCLTCCAFRSASSTLPGCREGVQEAAREEEGYFIRSGIVVVLRNQTIASGTII